MAPILPLFPLRLDLTQRNVQGLPPNTTEKDSALWSRSSYLKVSLDQVQENFKSFGLLDDQVAFHKGYFRYSLPSWLATESPQIAILRMDGDMYESTMDIFYNMWNYLPTGAWVVIDDWTIEECKEAVNEFLQRHGIVTEIIPVDNMSVRFAKPLGSPIDVKWYQKYNSSRGAEGKSGR